VRVVCVTGPSDASVVTEAQVATLRKLLAGADRLLHGVCVGADMIAHRLALELGVPEIVGYPGCDENGESPKRFYAEYASLGSDVYREFPAEPYLDRNRRMAEESTEVAAVVRKPTYYRSGEWSTVVRARKLGRPVTLVLPDGSTLLR
jgi:hypothetical protein